MFERVDKTINSESDVRTDEDEDVFHTEYVAEITDERRGVGGLGLRLYKIKKETASRPKAAGQFGVPVWIRTEYSPCIGSVLSMYWNRTLHVLDPYSPCTGSVLSMYWIRTLHVLGMYIRCMYGTFGAARRRRRRW
jgi:hypothetical protein